MEEALHHGINLELTSDGPTRRRGTLFRVERIFSLGNRVGNVGSMLASLSVYLITDMRACHSVAMANIVPFLAHSRV
jgi:hypothetical protein